MFLYNIIILYIGVPMLVFVIIILCRLTLTTRNECDIVVKRPHAFVVIITIQ